MLVIIGFYVADNLSEVFHRVIAGFMVLGGGFDRQLQQKETLDPIKNESANVIKEFKI